MKNKPWQQAKVYKEGTKYKFTPNLVIHCYGHPMNKRLPGTPQGRTFIMMYPLVD